MQLRMHVLKFIAELSGEERIEFAQMLNNPTQLSAILQLIDAIDLFQGSSKSSRVTESRRKGRAQIEGQLQLTQDRNWPSHANTGTSSLRGLFSDRSIFPTAVNLATAVAADFGIDIAPIVAQKGSRDEIAGRVAKRVEVLPDSQRRQGMMRLRDRLIRAQYAADYSELFGILSR